MLRERELQEACGHKVEVLPGEAVRQMEPAFTSSFKHAVYLENHATIRNPGELTKRFASLFEFKGGAFRQEAVTGLNRDGTRWRVTTDNGCLLYTSPSPRDVEESRMPSSA